MSAAMMNLAEKARLLKLSKAHFFSSGWIITPLTHNEDAFTVRKGTLKFLLICVDSRARQFYSATKIFDDLRDRSRNARKTLFLTTVFIFNKPFPGVDVEGVTHSGLNLVTIDELEIVSDLSRFENDIEEIPNARESCLLAGNEDFCLLVSARFVARQDYDRAIQWLRHSINVRGALSAANYRLFDLYVELRLFDEANKISSSALYLKPNDISFLRRMQKLSEKRSCVLEAEHFSQRIKQLEARKELLSEPDDFDALIKKQKAKRQIDMVDQSPSVRIGNKIVFQGLKQLFASVFVRKS